MSKKNTVSHDYMSDNAHFADVFNYYVYDGKQVIRPDELEEMDPTEEAVIKKLETIVTKNRIRDILKGVTIKTDGRITYAVLGIENQSDVHYGMPVRNSLYDALDYAAQVADIAKDNRRRKVTETSAEFLSGFMKEDRIRPVITLVMNWSDKRWDGPLTLSEMMEDVDERLKPFINDYRMNLIDPHSIDDFEKFRTELGDVLEFIRRQNRNEDLREMIEKKGPEWSLDAQSVNVINMFTGVGFSTDVKEGERIVMCKAIDEMMQESEKKGAELVNKLNVILLNTGRLDDLKKATEDPNYQKELIKELVDNCKKE